MLLQLIFWSIAPNKRASFLESFVDSIGPDRALDVVTSADIAGFIDDMRQRKVKYENHEWRPSMQGPLSSATIYKNIKMIKTFFKWCVDHGWGRAKLRLTRNWTRCSKW